MAFWVMIGVAVVLAVADAVLWRDTRRRNRDQRPRAVRWSQRRIDAEFSKLVEEQLRKTDHSMEARR